MDRYKDKMDRIGLQEFDQQIAESKKGKRKGRKNPRHHLSAEDSASCDSVSVCSDISVERSPLEERSTIDTLDNLKLELVVVSDNVEEDGIGDKSEENKE